MLNRLNKHLYKLSDCIIYVCKKEDIEIQLKHINHMFVNYTAESFPK